MAMLDKKLFLGEGGIDPGDAAKLGVSNNSNNVGEALKLWGWDGKTKCSAISLSISADNKRVEKAVLLVRGELEGKMAMEANKIWEKADSTVSLVMKLDQGELFSFSEGDLASDILSQESVSHAFYAAKEGRAPAPILEADYHEWGIGNFCLRLTGVISSTSSLKNGIVIKYSVLLFPDSKVNLLDRYELAQSAAWPGLRIAEGHMPLLPRPTKPWGCPVLPLILPGSALEQGNGGPTPETLRRAISGLMNKTVEVEAARTSKALLEKWRKILSQPGELTAKTGSITWPVPPAPAAENSK